jgi:flagellar motor switch protein FliN/FliY
MDGKDDGAQQAAAGPEKNNGAEGYDMEMILDIPLTVSVEFGKVKMLVNELLQLGQGSIVELNKAVGDPLDININDKLVAKGEVVVMEDHFGIRLTDIISPQERVRSLG